MTSSYSFVGEMFIRFILPSLLLFGILLWCCCTSEAPRRSSSNSEPSFESPQQRQERRDDIQAQLIVRRVLSTGKEQDQHTTPSTLRRLTSGDRAYSSFLSALQTSLSFRGGVKFSECINGTDGDGRLEQQGVKSNCAATQSCDEETAIGSSHDDDDDECHDNDDIIVPSIIARQRQEEEDGVAQYLSSCETQSQSHIPSIIDEEEEDVDDDSGAVVVTFDGLRRPGNDLYRSNCTDESWIPSDSSTSSSSVHSYTDDTENTVHSHSSPPPRRKSNLLARTLSTSLKSISANTNYQYYTSCDICLMDYEMGDEVCWSPNVECKHAFHVDCILDWLLRNPHCPVCRRNYLKVMMKKEQTNNHEQQVSDNTMVGDEQV